MADLIPRKARRSSPFDLAPFDRWLENAFGGNGWGAGFDASLPRADVSESDTEFCVSVELPGMDEKDVEVELLGDHLVVKGERKQRKEKKDKHFLRVECEYGSFERRFLLPSGVRADPDAIQARFDKGMLEIHLPKVEPRPVAKIQVKGT